MVRALLHQRDETSRVSQAYFRDASGHAKRPDMRPRCTPGSGCPACYEPLHQVGSMWAGKGPLMELLEVQADSCPAQQAVRHSAHNKPAKFAAKFVANIGVSSSLLTLLTPTANPGTLALNC